jgi:hypothetical protein
MGLKTRREHSDDPQHRKKNNILEIEDQGMNRMMGWNEYSLRTFVTTHGEETYQQ